MNKELTCIVCPRGCRLVVDENNNVTGNFCPRGKNYALSELSNPTRIITSIVRVSNRENMMVSVKTSSAIPKKLIFDILELLKSVKVEAPTHIGDVVISNVLDTGSDIIITKEVL